MKKIFTLAALMTALVMAGYSQVCDTLFNLQSDLDTPTVYIADTGTGAGYLSGNNVYGDLVKAEGFAAIPGDYVTAATLFFGVVTINTTDSDSVVHVYVYDNTGTSYVGVSGCPGNVLDSSTLTLRQIAQAVTFTDTSGELAGITAAFTGMAALTDTFYIGVVLPTTTGDTVALFTNIVPPGPDGDGWEYELNPNTGSGYVWGSYNDDWQFTGGSEGNYIAVDICGSAPVAAFTLSDSTGCAPLAVNFTDHSTQIPTAWYWTFGDGTNSSNQSPSHTYTTGGTYTVTEVAGNGNGSDTIIKTITVLPAPSISLQVSSSSSQGSDNGSVTASVTGGTSPYTYAWSNDSTGTSISNLAPGAYYLTVTDHNTCQSIDTAVVTVAGILQLSGGQQVKIYPNPASDVINFVWSQKVNAEIAIIDMNGKIVGTFETGNGLNDTYNVHDLASGPYAVRITDKATNQQQSIMFSKF